MKATRWFRFWACLALAALATACDSPANPDAVPLGREFELAPGASAQALGLRVTFEGVASDSRCPIDVTCVWEGDALVSLSLGVKGDASVRADLHTGGGLAREAEHAGYRVRLATLLPAPRSDVPIAPSDYRARLVVTR